jgi:hypothetical protein
MADWKKVIVSGSQAEFAGATGSFTGSFTGNGSGLTDLTATPIFPTTLLTPLTSATQIFVNDGANKYVTAGQITGSAYAGVSGDITISAAGVATIAADSVALGTDTTGNYVATIDPGAGLTGGATTGEGVAHTLAVGAGNYITVNANDVAVNTTTLTPAISGSIFTQISGDVTITAGGVSSIGSGVIVDADVNASAAIAASKINFSATSFVSASSLSSAAQGEVVLTTNGVAGTTVDLGLQTTDSPQFVALTLTGNLAINNSTSTAITTTGTTAAVFNTTATTVNAFGAATSLNLGAATGTTTVNNDLSVLGTLYVQGTVTAISSSNLYIADQFILLASGSTGDTDGGIIIDRGSYSSGNIAFGYDAGQDRWGFQNGLVDTTNAIDTTSAGGTSGSFAGYVFTEAAHTATKPTTGEFVQAGAIYTNTDGTIWMYA